jgi:hypothetical protein
LQAESDDLEVIGLALLYPALDGTFVFLAIMDIRVRSISFASCGPEGQMGHLITNALARPFLHVLILSISLIVSATASDTRGPVP